MPLQGGGGGWVPTEAGLPAALFRPSAGAVAAFDPALRRFGAFWVDRKPARTLCCPHRKSTRTHFCAPTRGGGQCMRACVCVDGCVRMVLVLDWTTLFQIPSKNKSIILFSELLPNAIHE